MKILQRVLLLSTISFMAITFGASAADKPKNVSGTVTVDIKLVAMMKGQIATPSTGVLTYQGKTYPVSISGLSIGKNVIGSSHLKASGEVYDLPDLASFEGAYTRVQGGIVPIKGGEVLLKNASGAFIRLVGESNGPVIISEEGAVVKFSK